MFVYIYICTSAPIDVPLLIKGSSDPCSSGQDIRFELIGFELQGQVSPFKSGCF